MLERQPRQLVERFDRTFAEVVVETSFRAVGSGWELQHGDLRAAPLELLAEREHRLQEIRARPDIGVWDDHRLAFAPVDAVEVDNRPAGGLPVPEAADGDAGAAFLIRLERLLLALGDQKRNGRIAEGRPGARRYIESRRRASALVVPDRVALAV